MHDGYILESSPLPADLYLVATSAARPDLTSPGDKPSGNHVYSRT